MTAKDITSSVLDYPMLKKLSNILLGLMLLPFCFGFTRQFFTGATGIAYKPDLPYYFVGGVFVYLIVHFAFRKPILTYVFGHEMTHALFAVLFGGSVKSFKASERGGQVTVTKSNFVITLAPYFFPLYTFIALVLYGVTKMAGLERAGGVLVFAAGATFCFHLVLTVVFLQTDQKDIREKGIVFSYPLIYLFNVIFAALLVYLLLARENGFLEFLGNGIIQSVQTVVFLSMKAYQIGKNFF